MAQIGSLFFGTLLIPSLAYAQTSSLTPFHARIVPVTDSSEVSGESTSFHLRIQLSEILFGELASHSVLEVELLNAGGSPVCRFDLAFRAPGGDVRFDIPLPLNLEEGFYILTLKTPGGAVRKSVGLSHPGKVEP